MPAAIIPEQRDIRAVSDNGERRIVRRRGLPRGRAVIGGFLVTLAAVGVFAAHRRAESPPDTAYAVLNRALAPNEEVRPGDIQLIPMELPTAQAMHAYSDLESLVGAVAIQALEAGELVERGDVRETGGVRSSGEVSFAVPVSRALGSSLRAGERVDVLATYGSGVDAYTTTVVSDAVVLFRGDAGGLAGADMVDVRLGVAQADEAMAVSHAVTVAEVSLVRAVEDGDGAEAPSVYRPPVAAERPPSDGAEPMVHPPAPAGGASR